jgi:hypothetical protein
MVLSATALLPAVSMAVHISRQLKLAGPLTKAAASPHIKIFVPALLCLMGIAVLLPKKQTLRKGLMKVLFVMLLVISPLILTSLYTVVKASTVVEDTAPKETLAAPHDYKPPLLPDGSIYLIIFDEMSYEYLYENGEVKKAFPNFRAFSSVADNYHDATAPGPDTMTSLPALLNAEEGLKTKVLGSRLYVVEKGRKPTELVPSPENILSMARAQGYGTALYGWYHDYCNIFKNLLDACKSYSIYNYAASAKGFSPLNPFFTNFNLWPYVYPAGYIKNLTSVPFQRNNANDMLDRSLKTLEVDEPYFYFIHFGVPHVPFVFDGSGYNPPADPFNPSDKNYINQLTYVDRMFGRFMAKMKDVNKFDNSTVVVMSDHNFRDKAPRDEWKEIPVIVKNKGQMERRDFHDPVRALSLIRQFTGS